MEQVTAEELRNPLIQARSIKATASGVTFRGNSMRTGYAACLWLRTAHRILHFVAHSKLATNQPAAVTVSEFVGKLENLDEYFRPGQSFGVQSSVWGSTTVKDNHTLNHIIQQAILQLSKTKQCPYLVVSVNGSAQVDVPFYATVYRNRIVLYRDMTGPFLNSRGYRRVHHEAALSETQAAGLLYLVQWDKISRKEGAVFVDPMCGNGTLLCEAALMAKNHAPGLLRSSWPFLQWKDFNRDVWNRLIRQAESRMKPNWSGHILGCDIHPIATELAHESRKVTAMEEVITLAQGNCKDWKLKIVPDVVVVNPPWAIKKRSEKPPLELCPTLKQSWKELGQFLWNTCKGSKAYFPCNHPFLYRSLGLDMAERMPLWIGGTMLGFYAVHLHDTAAVNRHRSKREEVSPEKELRTKQDRQQEIEKAAMELSTPRKQEVAQNASASDSNDAWTLTYNWKFRKFESQSTAKQKLK